jgi:GNAT superfamily N-acetyltransferase
MKQRSEMNRKALESIVSSGEIPGILAYANGEPIRWCSVGPREAYSALEPSRVLKRVDDRPVWSVVCFFVAKRFRGKGLARKLLRASVELVRKHDGKILEGYPVELTKGRIPDAFAYTGVASAFRQAGFVEVLRRSESRPIMRHTTVERQNHV